MRRQLVNLYRGIVERINGANIFYPSATITEFIGRANTIADHYRVIGKATTSSGSSSSTDGGSTNENGGGTTNENENQNENNGGTTPDNPDTPDNPENLGSGDNTGGGGSGAGGFDEG